MSNEPTDLEKQAASLELDALARVDEAIGHLRAAERALLDEERQHGLYVSIDNQHRLIAYADILAGMMQVREDIIARLTGTTQAAA